ncbi:hypothetical protein B0H65DRAFT_146007 [Neurospora tetraspora]|uniref:Uncharacterized protein n=1 Tax=Neurospora tetraspora TaxID=94610 RepID=A0AAE0JMK7_9PEZI|nr:hypothetical protein B0H65DRAFT_146007 [Neurospora tetraspora]
MKSSTPNQKQHAPPDINLSALLEEAKSKLEQVEKLLDVYSRLSKESTSCFESLVGMLQGYESNLDKDMSTLKNLIKIGGKLSVYEAWIGQQGLNSPNVDPKELVCLQKAKQGVFEKIRNHKIAPPPKDQAQRAYHMLKLALERCLQTFDGTELCDKDRSLPMGTSPSQSLLFPMTAAVFPSAAPPSSSVFPAPHHLLEANPSTSGSQAKPRGAFGSFDTQICETLDGPELCGKDSARQRS